MYHSTKECPSILLHKKVQFWWRTPLTCKISFFFRPFWAIFSNQVLKLTGSTQTTKIMKKPVILELSFQASDYSVRKIIVISSGYRVLNLLFLSSYCEVWKVEKFKGGHLKTDLGSEQTGWWGIALYLTSISEISQTRPTDDPPP